MATTTINVPATITLTNTSSTRKVGFIPYKENFTVLIAAGNSVVLEVPTAGQVFYYLAQQENDSNLSVTQAAVQA